VSYEQALYSALSGALARRPGATFDLVAVAPQSGNTAEVTSAQNRSKRDAERVLRSMSEMGLPMDRVRLSAMTSQSARGLPTPNTVCVRVLHRSQAVQAATRSRSVPHSPVGSNGV
jgi:hypothetical protein